MDNLTFWSSNFSQNCLDNDSSNPISNTTTTTLVIFFKPLILNVPAIAVTLGLLIQIWRHSRLHTSVNKLVASLCICDCIKSVIGLALIWPYNIKTRPKLCLALYCLYCVTFLVTFIHFMIISVERYIHIVHPFVHIRLVTTNRPLATCIFLVWAVSFFIAFVPFFVTLKPNWSQNCWEISLVLPFWFYSLSYLFVFIIATTVVGVLYINIYRVARRHIDAMEKRQTFRLQRAGKKVFSEGHLTTNSNILSKRRNIDRSWTGPTNIKIVEKEHENNLDVVKKANSRRMKSKLRSAIPFLFLYIYYFMSWAPMIVVKTYVAYTERVFAQKLVSDISEVISMFSSTGYCILFMFLEKEVRKVTLDKIFSLFRQRHWSTKSGKRPEDVLEGNNPNLML